MTAASAIDRLFCTKQPAAWQGRGGFELHQRDPACFAARLCRVLYVDGEREAKCNGGLPLVGGLEPEAAPDYFRMLSADASARGLPDLATSEGQRIFRSEQKTAGSHDERNKKYADPLHKRYDASSAFTPETLLREARRQKGLALVPVPEVCILDPDGDMVRYLRTTGPTGRHPAWACYDVRRRKQSRI